MPEFLFETVTTMKDYNREKWWIDSKIIPNITLEAPTLREALHLWREIVQDEYYVTISDNAMKTKRAMYQDTNNGPVQVGYVITGQTDFDNDRRGWVKQYIDLWVNISVISNPFTAEV